MQGIQSIQLLIHFNHITSVSTRSGSFSGFQWISILKIWFMVSQLLSVQLRGSVWCWIRWLTTFSLITGISFCVSYSKNSGAEDWQLLLQDSSKWNVSSALVMPSGPKNAFNIDWRTDDDAPTLSCKCRQAFSSKWCMHSSKETFGKYTFIALVNSKCIFFITSNNQFFQSEFNAIEFYGS